jgi:hypothetical protein
VLRIRFFPSRIPEPGSNRFRIAIQDPDPHHRIKYPSFNPKVVLKDLRNMISDVHPGSSIRILIFNPSGYRSQKAPDLGSATLIF